MDHNKITISTLITLSIFLIVTGFVLLKKDETYYKKLTKEFNIIEKNEYNNKIPDLETKAKKLGKIHRDDFTKNIKKYKNYIKAKELINKYTKDGYIITNATTINIKEIDKTYEKLDNKYKKKLKNQLNILKSQLYDIKIIQNKIDDLFINNDKNAIKEDTTIEQIDKYIEELNNIKQKDFVIKNIIYLTNAKNTLEEKRRKEIEAAWVKLDVPYISQNKNNILNGCEAASMLMALQYKGYLKDMALSEYVKLMPLSPDTDAEKGFTHDMYTLDPLTVPHWIAPEPLKNFGIDTSGNQNIINGTGMSIDELDRELDNGNPVIIYLIAKFNPPKETVEGVPRNLHVMLLTGYNKITGEHYIVDPWTHDDGRTSWTVSKDLITEKYELLSRRNVIIR